MPLADALGQVLAADVISPFDLPPLENTGMDGYAVQAARHEGASDDLAGTLRLIGELAAGYIYETAQSKSGEAVRIMTGAPIPRGADAVVPFEETDEMNRARGNRPAPGDDVASSRPRTPARTSAPASG